MHHSPARRPESSAAGWDTLHAAGTRSHVEAPTQLALGRPMPDGFSLHSSNVGLKWQH
jgi:hypothetical protein